MSHTRFASRIRSRATVRTRPTQTTGEVPNVRESAQTDGKQAA